MGRSQRAEIFGLKSDGTIISTDEDFRDDPLSEWRNIAKTMFYDDIRLGIRSDGTIVWDSSYYTYHYGFSHDDISAWKDIKDISIGYNGGHIVGLENDGTVVAAGDNKYGQCDVSDWTDFKAIYAKNGATLGLKNDGTVVAAGNDAYGELGVSQWTDMEEIYVGYNYTVGLRSDGIVATAGRGSPAVSGWSGVVSLITNSHGVFGLKSDGRVVYVGEKYIDEISKLQNIVYIKLHSDKLFALQGNGDLKIIGLDSDVERGEYDYLKQIKLNLSGIAVNLNS
jgi:alpha-tubulin suppressor-like RCC1 family protein